MKLNKENFPKTERVERVLQFGEGGFLRAFPDWMIDTLNDRGLFDGSIVIVQPIPEGRVKELNEQDGLYTLILQGVENGKTVRDIKLISSVSRGIDPYTQWQEFLKTAQNIDIDIIISNTTEAGIAYDSSITALPVDSCPVSFPAKVTAWLYERFKHFAGKDCAVVFLPCELIDRNGDKLKECVKKHAEDWGLGAQFLSYINESCEFASTLVDRIVTGFPRDNAAEIYEELGYEDNSLNCGEIFHLWVIEGGKRAEQKLKFTEAGLNVIWTDNMEPYRTCKVRILNGAHTSTSLYAYLKGCDTVRDFVEDEFFAQYLKSAIFDEIIPTFDLPQEEKVQFANDVIERFKNPYIDHQLLSIALNSVSKFKVRVLPSLLKYAEMYGKSPENLSTSLAALIRFYKIDSSYMGCRGTNKYAVKDDDDVLEFFASLWSENAKDYGKIAQKVLGKTEWWECDLNNVAGLTEAVKCALEGMDS